jgi:hypothetical protein
MVLDGGEMAIARWCNGRLGRLRLLCIAAFVLLLGCGGAGSGATAPPGSAAAMDVANGQDTPQMDEFDAPGDVTAAVAADTSPPDVADSAAADGADASASFVWDGVPLPVHCENPTAGYWSYVFGGGNTPQSANSLVLVDDYAVVAGWTKPTSLRAGMLLAVDKAGKELWKSAHFGKADEEFTAVLKTADGFIAAGTSFPADSESTGVIALFDELGNQTTTTYVANPGGNLSLHALAAHGAEFVAAGVSSGSGSTAGQGPFLVRVNSSGVKVWSAVLQAPQPAQLHSIIAAGAGGITVAGTSAGNVWLGHLGGDGDLQWSQSYPLDGIGTGWALAPRLDSDGSLLGYAVAASVDNSGIGQATAWLLQTDATGNKQSATQLATEPSHAFGLAVLAKGKDAGFAVVGRQTVAEQSRGWIWRLDAQGKALWTGKSFLSAVGRAVVRDSSGAYWLAGFHDFTAPAAWVARLGPNGEICP